MSLCLRALAGILFLASFAAPAAHAQSSSSASSGSSAVEVDFRLGELWPADGDVPSAGGRMAFYLWPEGQARRVSVYGAGDYRRTSRVEGFDEVLRTRTLTEQSLATFAGGIGIDLWRTPGWVVDARAGGSVVRTGTDVSINSADGFTRDRNEYENVCPFQGFGYLCTSDYEAGAAFGLGVRGYLTSSRSVYVGVDYTRFTQGYDLLVGSVGLRLE